uniref:Anthocyanin acyltransferase n=1 Tax=Solanum tuberosum TaxID=4113 RepID=M0ZZG1_SOLTU
MEIEILCKELIKPCLPTPPHLQRYKLSFFDQISEKEHVPIVLFYANNNFINNSTIDKRVEQSFSKVLTHVYPAARRYDKDECSILCLDQGISYTKAKVNYKLYNFLEKARKDLSLAALFWPHENKYINKTNLMVSPIVMAQVIEFECGGLAVSLSSSHPAMDGFSNIKFLFEWAKVCKMDTPVEKINFLSFNLGNVFRTRDISRLFKSTYDSVIEKNIIVKRFVINEAVMLRLRKKCIEESSGALTFQPSRVEIITALLWRAYIRASATINWYIRPSLMALPLNLRAKTSLPQVHNSMGNFRIDVPIKFISEETKKELHNYIILIRNAMNKVVASCTKASPDEIVSTVINTYNESFEAPKWGGNDGVDKVVSSSLCNFPFHDTDFGLEKPTLLFLV